MENIPLKYLLMCVCILASNPSTFVSGQCSTPPKNLAAYEGSPFVVMSCSSPTRVSWTVYPTDDERTPTSIIDNGTIVADPLKTLYGASQDTLTIKKAQSSPDTPPITTSGIYVANYSTNGSNIRVAAKLVVVRDGPSCNCTAINRKKNKLSCLMMYADSTVHAIYPKVAWTADGKFVKKKILYSRNKVNGAFTSTSTISISSMDKRNYKCKVTFTSPVKFGTSYIAKNAPAFSQSCTPNCRFHQ